ncbi:MAG TPA: class I SAM-dependent methyltransferase [Ktedonobacteraceae bacterium]|nr:class I SAM-dependent methyltransferase [Ktedonobacteraceae bacterium]
MSTQTDPFEKNPENTYVLDSESAAEMARLLDQGRLVTETMGGFFPEDFDLSNIHDVLDIACGPGEWVHGVAHTYPHINVTGIDISNRMIDYANAHAQVRHLHNTHFEVRDALKLQDFAEESFDFINARTLVCFMQPAAWPRLVQQCMRLLRPGGYIRLTEAEWGICNKFAFEDYAGKINMALRKANMSLSPTGLHMGITAMLARYLKDAGCQDIQRAAYVIDYSAGEKAHGGYMQDLKIGFKQIQPFLAQVGVVPSLEAAEDLYQQVLADMEDPDFCSISYLLSVWGAKPAA